MFLIKKAIVTSAALEAPSAILIAKAHFLLGIIATNTPSAPPLKKIFPSDNFVKIEPAH